MSSETASSPMMQGTATTVTFARLKTAEHYPPWAFFVETYLEGEGLWDIVSGAEPYPPLPPTSTTAPTTTPAPSGILSMNITVPEITTAPATPEIRAWKRNDAKARAKILTLLDESLFARF